MIDLPAHLPTPRNELEDAKGEIRALRDGVADLQRRLERQAVLVRALFAVLSAKQGLTETELIDRFREVEAERRSAPAKKCPDCGRGVNQRTQRCIYCGSAYEVETAFDLLELGSWPSLQPGEPESELSVEEGITTRPAFDGITRPHG